VSLPAVRVALELSECQTNTQRSSAPDRTRHESSAFRRGPYCPGSSHWRSVYSTTNPCVAAQVRGLEGKRGFLRYEEVIATPRLCCSLHTTGPCQFPTLGFVVARFNQVQAFRPETFWYIYLAIKKRENRGPEKEVVFSWNRGHLFDQDIALLLYQSALARQRGVIVTKVTNKNTEKW